MECAAVMGDYSDGRPSSSGLAWGILAHIKWAWKGNKPKILADYLLGSSFI